MFCFGDDYLSTLLTEGPPAARCELLRSLTSDDFGPRVLATLREEDRAVIVRGIAIADAAWTRAARQLAALAAVHEDHVAPLVGYGRHEGLAYFIHEHDDGPRLNAVLHERGGSLPLATLLPVFGQLLLAVGRAHRHGVVVGGVRPQDVRVLSSDVTRIRVRNLGLAAVLGVPAGRTGATDHPAIYRAPEADVAADPASDVFSLGVLFVRMLTGPLPLPTTEAERFEQLRSRVEQALRDDPSFTDGLATLVLESVDPDLATRPRDAQRLLEALLEVVPASALRLPADAPKPAPRVAEHDSPSRPAQRWTVIHGPDRGARPTPVPLHAARTRVPSHASRHGSMRPSMTPTIERAAAASTRAAAPAEAATVVPLVRRPAQRRGLLGRVLLGTGLLSTGTALALAIAVGEPGATPTAGPAASLAALTEAPADGPAPVPAEGTLVVETTPPGVLTVDGRRLGSTPHRGPLPPGRHVVRVEAPGHRAWRARVEIAAGQARRLEAALEPDEAGSELASLSVAAR